MKKTVRSLLMAVLLLCLGAAVLTACGEQETPPPAEKVTVTYVLGDHAKGGVEAPKQADVEKGSQITLAAAPEAADGWEFDGWQVGSDTTLKQPNTKVTVNENVTITAKWKEKTVTPPPAEKVKVTYALGDHAKAGAEAPKQADVEKGSQITLAAAPEAEEGWEFDGWQVGSDTALKQPNTKVTVNENVTITAKWKEKTVTPPAEKVKVTYALGDHAKEGAAVPTQADVEKDTQITLPQTDPEAATGYKFIGWKVNDETTLKQKGEKVMISAETTITAQWQFILDGVWKGTIDATPLGGKGTADVEFTIQGVEGEDFNAYFIFDVVTEGLETNFFTTIKVEGEELHAVMTMMNEAPATFTIDNDGKLKVSISVEDDGPSVVKTITVPRVSDVPAVSKMAEGTYYVYEDISCYTVFTVTGDAITNGDDLSFTMKYVGAHVLLFNSPAQEDVPDYFVLTKKTKGYYCFMGDDGWDILTDAPVKVTFDLGTGSLPSESENGYRQGTTLDDIAALGFNPPRDTVFDGWCDEKGVALEGSTVLENGKTYTAKWKSTLPPVEKAHVTYVLGDHAAEGAEAPTQDDVDKNTEITLAAAPEAAEGWEFDGWQVGSDPELKQPNTKVTIADDTTITAKWKEKTVTPPAEKVKVTYNLGNHAKDGAVVPTQDDVEKDTQITLPQEDPEAATGYKFIGWKVNDETTLKQKGEEVSISAETTITAQWQFILDGVWKGTQESDETSIEIEFTIQGVEGEDFNAYFVFDFIMDGEEQSFFTTVKVEGEELKTELTLMDGTEAKFTLTEEGQLTLDALSDVTFTRISDVPEVQTIGEGQYYGYEGFNCVQTFTVEGDAITDGDGTAYTIKYVGAHVLLFNNPSQGEGSDFIVFLKKTDGYYAYMGDGGMDILTDAPVKVTFELGGTSIQGEENKLGYKPGTTLDEIAALITPLGGKEFDGWSGDDGDLDGTTVLEDGKTYTAKWKEKFFTLNFYDGEGGNLLKTLTYAQGQTIANNSDKETNGEWTAIVLTQDGHTITGWYYLNGDDHATVDEAFVVSDHASENSLNVYAVWKHSYKNGVCGVCEDVCTHANVQDNVCPDCGAKWTAYTDEKSYTTDFGKWGSALTEYTIAEGEHIILNATYADGGEKEYNGVIARIAQASGTDMYFIRPAGDSSSMPIGDTTWGKNYGDTVITQPGYHAEPEYIALKKTGKTQMEIVFENDTLTLTYRLYNADGSLNSAAPYTMTYTITNMTAETYKVGFGLDGATLTEEGAKICIYKWYFETEHAHDYTGADHHCKTCGEVDPQKESNHDYTGYGHTCTICGKVDPDIDSKHEYDPQTGKCKYCDAMNPEHVHSFESDGFCTCGAYQVDTGTHSGIAEKVEGFVNNDPDNTPWEGGATSEFAINDDFVIALTWTQGKVAGHGGATDTPGQAVFEFRWTDTEYHCVDHANMRYNAGNPDAWVFNAEGAQNPIELPALNRTVTKDGAEGTLPVEGGTAYTGTYTAVITRVGTRLQIVSTFINEANEKYVVTDIYENFFVKDGMTFAIVMNPFACENLTACYGQLSGN